MPEVKLSFMEKDALAEVASIACGNASAALSSMLGDREIGITSPTTDMTLLKDVVKLVGGPKKLVVGIYTQVSGDLSGNAAVVFSRESAFLLADLLKNKKLGTTQVIKEEDQKLINDAGLAIVSSYLIALRTFLELKMNHGDPKFFSTFGESVTDFIVVGFEEAEETFLVNSFRTPFSIGPNVKGEFMFMLALKLVDSFLEAIRSKLRPSRRGGGGGRVCIIIVIMRVTVALDEVRRYAEAAGDGRQFTKRDEANGEADGPDLWHSRSQASGIEPVDVHEQRCNGTMLLEIKTAIEGCPN